jgi:hypothetical protein
MYDEYQFFFAPYSENYDALQKDYEAALRNEIEAARKVVEPTLNHLDSLSILSDEALKHIQEGAS